MLVVVIVGIAADVRPLVDDQHLFVERCCESFRYHTAGEAGAYDEVIEHGCSLGSGSGFGVRGSWVLGSRFYTKRSTVLRLRCEAAPSPPCTRSRGRRAGACGSRCRPT